MKSKDKYIYIVLIMIIIFLMVSFLKLFISYSCEVNDRATVECCARLIEKKSFERVTTCNGITYSQTVYNTLWDCGKYGILNSEDLKIYSFSKDPSRLELIEWKNDLRQTNGYKIISMWK